MIGARPRFMDSPFFVMEEDNWHLKEGAPEDVVKEFNDYMNGDGLMNRKPVKKSFTEKIDDLLSGN
jgi:hypothetical protein